MAIIQSILDNDLYKCSMQCAIIKYRQGIPVVYRFNNRRPEGKFNEKFMEQFFIELKNMEALQITEDEYNWLHSNLGWLGQDYLQYLKNYRFNSKEVEASLKDGELNLEIRGLWEKTILWEVPLMALISELYFQHCDTNWTFDTMEQIGLILTKANKLKTVKFADFGTRRRRSYSTQLLVNEQLTKHASEFPYIGTSNMHIAMLLGVKALGTMAHEFIMGVSALEGLRHANRHALKIWSKIYQGNLGTALTDTFGSDAFFEDFDNYLARIFDSIRHDSGCPFKFIDKAVEAYKKHSIHPMTKTIIFSDGLDADMALEIAKYAEGKINVSFGIGTNFTNDFINIDRTDVSKPLNMVIKLVECNKVPVVKLSDTPTKAIGDRDALRVAKWTFFKQPLDQE